MTAETKWTPGPWVAMNYYSAGSHWTVQKSPGGGCPTHDISRFVRSDSDTSGWSLKEHDAKLIAQAPELYDLLSEALPYLLDHDDRGPVGEGYQSDELVRLIEEAQSALAKARGES